MKSLALLLITCALTGTLMACSNTGNPYANGNGTLGTPGNPANGSQGSDQSGQLPNEKTPGGVPSSPVEEALRRHAWCATEKNQGVDIQQRLSILNHKDYEFRFFDFTGAKRGNEYQQGRVHGEYLLDGGHLSLMPSTGQTISAQIRIDPSDAQTGAERLHAVVDGVDNIYDPCL